jgi:Uma2 family endonuclease
MAEPAEKRWTVEEFLAWDDGTDRRYELVGGQIVAMAPPSEAHAAIVANLTLRIGSQLRPPCRVLGEFGVRLPGRDDSFYQFDLAVTCAAADPARRYIAEPEMIIEVLSPSTALHDRGRKLDHYRQLPALKEILLVASEERRVQHWRRRGARWVVDDLIGDADLRLATVPDPGRSTRAAACKLDVAPRHRYPRGSIARKAWTSARERDELRIQLPQPPG